MSWQMHEGQRKRVVREDELLAYFRDRLKANPAHQKHMERLAREAGRPVPQVVRTPRPKQPRPAPVVQVDEELGEREYSITDVLAEMKRVRGSWELLQLREAMTTQTASCQGMDAFTADVLDDEEAVVMASICRGCPLVALCRSFAEVERPSEGFWAGQHASHYRRRSTTAQAVSDAAA